MAIALRALAARRSTRSLELMLNTLRNPGPKSEAMLKRSGIFSVEQLRELGDVRAYVRVKRNERGRSRGREITHLDTFAVASSIREVA